MKWNKFFMDTDLYLRLKHDVPAIPNLGGSLWLHLSAMSPGFYQELTARGKNAVWITQIFYDIAWRVYRKMGRVSCWLADVGNRNRYNRLLKATKLFRAFPFNSPSYQWKDVRTENNMVGFDCLKCPVAEYFQTKGLSEFCTKTWCALD
jgi:ubiquinone biosynthesis protein